MTEIILSILAGLVLFLFAVFSLSEVIQKVAGERAEQVLRKFTKSVFTAVLAGTIVTAILDSSSAVIILTIILVNSKVLDFRRAMGIVLGANIGTTISSQIIAMDVGKFSPIFLVIGFVLLIASKSDRLNNTGKVVLYFGVLFFGLYTMEKAVEPLREEAFFMQWLERIKEPIPGALTGALVTLVVQSSSATVGMAIILAKKGIISLSGGIAVMLGAELGTVSDTLLATIKGSRQTIKTGLFHLIFNLLSIVLGLIFFYPFVKLVESISGTSHIEHALANAHMLFNIGGVLVFVWFLPLFEKGLNKLLPEKEAAIL